MKRMLSIVVVIGGAAAALLLYARVIEPGDWPLLSLARANAAGLDAVSLIVGGVAGYLVAALVRFPWKELPERVIRSLNRLVPTLQLAICAVVCAAVLVYW